MNPRAFEILDRLDSIEIEAELLRNELREILGGEKTEWVNNEQDDFSMFKDTTSRLLMELWNAPDQMLSQEDIRQDVILDEYASDTAIRSVIKRARNEMRACDDCHYEIKSISKKGYRLVKSKMRQIVPKTRKLTQIDTKNNTK